MKFHRATQLRLKGPIKFISDCSLYNAKKHTFYSQSLKEQRLPTLWSNCFDSALCFGIIHFCAKSPDWPTIQKFLYLFTCLLRHAITCLLLILLASIKCFKVFFILPRILDALTPPPPINKKKSINIEHLFAPSERVVNEPLASIF